MSSYKRLSPRKKEVNNGEITIVVATLTLLTGNGRIGYCHTLYHYNDILRNRDDNTYMCQESYDLERVGLEGLEKCKRHECHRYPSTNLCIFCLHFVLELPNSECSKLRSEVCHCIA